MIIFIATKVLGVKLAFDGNGGDFRVSQGYW